MVSDLAIEDIQSIIDEGGVVSPRDVITLNALGLKITNSGDCELASLPRFASLDGVTFRQPDVQHEIFLDELDRLFAHDDATYVAIQGWVMAHTGDELKDEYLTQPHKLVKVIHSWLKDSLKTQTFNQLERVVLYCRYGCDPVTGEYPLYMLDELASKAEDALGGDKSWALRHYLEACTLGISDVAALRVTSDKLAAMIERAYIVRGTPLKKDEGRATAAYYKTLEMIKAKAFKKDEENTGDLNGGQQA